MKKIIKLTHLIVFVSCGNLRGLVERACSMKADSPDVFWVDRELGGIVDTSAGDNEVEKYAEMVSKQMLIAGDKERNLHHVRFKGLDRLLHHCVNLLQNKNEWKMLLLKELSNLIRSDKWNHNKIEGIAFNLIYQPGSHFFTDKNVGAFLESLLVEGKLTQEELGIIIGFTTRNRSELDGELKLFTSNLSGSDELRKYLSKQHLKSIQNFWEGLCNYLDRPTTLHNLVQKACNMKPDQLAIDWVDLELEGIRPATELSKEVKHYCIMIGDAMRIASDKDNQSGFSNFKALDRLLHHCVNLLKNKNRYKSLFFKTLLEALQDKGMEDINKIGEIIGCLIYLPGGHFFTDDKDVGTFLERLLITGKLDEKDLTNLLEFIQENRDELDSQLQRFLSDGDLYQLHAQSIENFWKGLCDYLDKPETEKLIYRLLVCAKILMKDNGSTISEFFERLFSIIEYEHIQSTCPNPHMGVILEKLSLQNKLTQDEIEGLAELERIGGDNLYKELLKFGWSNPHIEAVRDFCLGFYEHIEASELKKFTQRALASLDLGMPIPAMPNNMTNNEDDELDAEYFVELLEPEARDNPALVRLLSAWISLLPVDEDDEESIFPWILTCTTSIEKIQDLFWSSDLLSLRGGINPSTATEKYLPLIIQSLKGKMLDQEFKQEFDCLIQELPKMCSERRVAIQNLLEAINLA